jgi:peptide/nickel transport system ATP-binding protein
VREIFLKPLHPYTEGLMAAIPGKGPAGGELASISGMVPDLIQPPEGCRFHPRCPIAETVCRRERPALEPRASGRRVACHRR